MLLAGGMRNRTNQLFVSVYTVEKTSKKRRAEKGVSFNGGGGAEWSVDRTVSGDGVQGRVGQFGGEFKYL